MGRDNTGFQALPPFTVPPASGRLDSWKEIAAYLKRGVRTVRRWEKEEGLPVHRHIHQKMGTVYASKSELDAWWINRRPRLEQREHASILRLLSWALAVVALIVATSLAVRLARRPLPAFQQRDWVLITSFENRTGEAVLDGTLEFALARDLSDSRFVNVVPRERIEDALRLMRKAADTRVDAVLGREICLRDGGIRALLTGRVETLGSAYDLSVEVVDPARGVTVASMTAEAAGRGQLLPAVHRLAKGVRESLGEKLSLIERSDQKFEKVTTPSLRALHLYTQADALIYQDKPAAAEELLRQAVKEDPGFASAYIHLAWAIYNQGRPKTEVYSYAKRAHELSETANERERYFIVGSYHQILGQYEKAIAAYEALLRLYPDHYWATNNLSGLYRRVGRSQEAVQYFVRRAELRPNDFRTNLGAAQGLVLLQKDPLRAKPYLERAQAIASAHAETLDSEELVSFETFQAFEEWLKGDLTQVERAMARVSQSSGKCATIECIQSGALFYLMLGELSATQEWYTRMPDPLWRQAGLAVVAFARGDVKALRQRVLRLKAKRYSSPTIMILLVRAGLLSEAENFIRDLKEVNFSPGLLKLGRGELALAHGNMAEAISLLKEGRQLRVAGAGAAYFLASESLALAYERRGQVDQAVLVLEEASQERAAAYLTHVGPIGYFWMRTQVHLAKLYRKLGREAEAQKVEAQLLKLLARADPDHPFLVQLKGKQGVALADFEKLPEELRQKFATFDEYFKSTFDNLMLSLAPTPFYRHFLDYDPIPSFQRVACPVLILFAERDVFVSRELNEKPIVDALKKAGNKGFTVKVIPRADHYFKDAASSRGEFAAGFLDVMSTWILAGVNRRK